MTLPPWKCRVIATLLLAALILAAGIICVLNARPDTSSLPEETSEGQSLAENSPKPVQERPRSEILRNLSSDPSLGESRSRFLTQARKILAKPVITRPDTLEALRESRIGWDKRYDTADASIRETFSLARADAMASSWMQRELPQLAAAYVLTGEPAFLDRVLAQMDEMTRWVPFQRPGWSSFSTQKLPPPDGDGVWLATGRNMLALVETLEILPEKDVPSELRERIRKVLQAESAQIVEDWKVQRPWYVRAGEVRSNQWAIPLVGLVSATTWLGRSENEEAYEFGVQNLLKSLDGQSDSGSYNEGLVYGTATIQVLLPAARLAAQSGDRRLIDHPFLHNFPIWHTQQLQPGEYVINAFDCGFGARGGLRHFFPIYSDMAVLLQSPEALWVVQQNPEQEDDSLNGILARALPVTESKEPPLFGEYPNQINWRSSWAQNASGFWMRGGDVTDFHDHMDRGHVNFISRGRAILIETGTPGYDTLDINKTYRSVAGHNVLQVGDFDLADATVAQLTQAGQPLVAEHRAAPIDVERMDADGGEASVDLSEVYPKVEKWIRHVRWSEDAVDIRDEVILKEPDIVLFRWHLGSPTKLVKWFRGELPAEDPVLQPDSLDAPGYRVEFDGDQPLTARLESAPDVTLGHQSEHHCLVVRSQEPVKELTLHTQIKSKP